MTTDRDPPSDEDRLAEAQTLGALLQLVGYALWQAAECEDTLAHYVVVRLKAQQGVGEEVGLGLLKKAQGRTFGSLLSELRSAGVLSEALEGRLIPLLQERNWLVHHAKRESRGVLYDPDRFDSLVQRMQNMAEEATQVNSILASDLEEFVVSSGVDRATIDAEAKRLVDEWGL